ncbi:hypothetical protein BKA81DRAFT_344187 [Phyllosticta paracitricarpa]
MPFPFSLSSAPSPCIRLSMWTVYCFVAALLAAPSTAARTHAHKKSIPWPPPVRRPAPWFPRYHWSSSASLFQPPPPPPIPSETRPARFSASDSDRITSRSTTLSLCPILRPSLVETGCLVSRFLFVDS